MKRTILVYGDNLVVCEGGEMKEISLTDTHLRKLWQEEDGEGCEYFPNGKNTSAYDEYGAWDFIVGLLYDGESWGFIVFEPEGMYESGTIPTLDEAVKKLLEYLNGGGYE